MRRLAGLGVIAALLAGNTALAQPQATPPLRRIVEFPYPVRVTDYCSVPSFVVGLARKLMVPVGVEYLAGRCHTSNQPREMDVEVDVLGVTVEVALDRLVAADPRYRWLESDGVILLRPLEAWADKTNWLNQPIGSFVVDEQDLVAALREIQCRIPEARCHFEHNDPIAMRTELGARRFSVNLAGTSVMGALNASLRAHGAMWWEARDRAGVTQPEDHRMFWLLTPDGSGLGMPTKRYASIQ